MKKTLDGTVLKVHDELGIVFGYVIVNAINGTPYYDLQGDHIPENAMLKAAYKYMLGDRPALVQHSGDLSNPQGKVVFAFPMTDDIAKAMNITVEKTGLIVGIKFFDTEIFRKYKEGVLKGFSIGGKRVTDEDVADD